MQKQGTTFSHAQWTRTRSPFNFKYSQMRHAKRWQWRLISRSIRPAGPNSLYMYSLRKIRNIFVGDTVDRLLGFQLHSSWLHLELARFCTFQQRELDRKNPENTFQRKQPTVLGRSPLQITFSNERWSVYCISCPAASIQALTASAKSFLILRIFSSAFGLFFFHCINIKTG